MEFTGSLNLDNHPLNAKSGQWKRAKNILLSKGFKAANNEEGFTLNSTVDRAIVGICKVNNEYVVFSTGDIDTDILATCEIGVVRNDIYTTVLKDVALGFRLWNPIEAVFHKNFKGEVIVAWCDGLNDDSNSPRILNIDNLPFPVDGNKALINPNDVNLLNIFPNFTLPYTSNVEIVRGGDLKSGSYHFAYTYELRNNERLLFTRTENAIPITDEALTEDFNDVDGCEANTNTSNAIRLTINNIDISYNYLVIGVISIINQQKAGYIFRRVLITGASMVVTVDSLANAEVIDYREIIIPKAVYTRAETITTVNDELHIAQLKKADLYGFQKYANNIKVEWLRDASVNLDGQAVNSYKDGKIVFFLKGFASDEVYAFYIVLRLDNGEVTPAYHIPGRRAYNNLAGGTQDNDPTRTGERLLLDAAAAAPEEDDLLGSNVYYFQTRNTARLTYNPDDTHGEMGFWENEDETYPDVGQEGEENGVVYDSSEVQVDSIQGEKVRHHRFPDYDFFGAAGYEIAEADVVYEETDTVGDAAFEVSEEAALFLKRGYVDTTVNATSANVTITNTVVALAGWTVDPVTMNNVIITFNAARRVVLRYRIKADVEAGQNSGLIYPSGGGNSSLRANLGLYDSTNTIITSFENIIDTAASNGLGAVVLGIDSGTVTVAFDVAVGDYLQFECYYEISHNAVLMDFAMTEDASDTTFLLRDFDLSVVNNLVTKPLGIIVKDIYIPSDLRDRVQAVEIFYAKRNTNNSIIVDKSLVFDYNWNTNVFNVTRGRFHPFTMLNRQIEATPNYVKKYFEIRDNAIGVDFEDHMIVDFNNVLSERFTFLNSFRLRILDKQKYLPYDNIATIPSNDEREFCYYAEMNSLPTGGGKAYSWVALCNYRTNCYLSLEQQTLVSTGMLLIVNKGTGNQVDLESYGGDTFTNLLAVSLRYPANTIWVTHYIPIESVDNTSLRNELEDETFKYYPKSPFPNVWNDPNIDPALNQYDYYNRDYTALNDLVVQVIWAMFDELADYTSNFPYRIAYSEQTIDESVQLTWRDFKVDNYYEMPRDKGVITKIQGTNKTLFINHEYSMFVAQIKDKLLTNVTEIYLGTTNIFDRLPDEIVAIPEGYIGCTSQFACFVSKIGYIVIDRKQGKVFAVTDKLNEISNEFVREYLRDNLQTDSIDVTIDNPFTQFGITAGFDEKWNRLLISKVDYSVTPLMQGLIDANEVSFSENGFYVRELEFTTNFPIKSVTIPDVVLYMTKVTINGIDYVCDTPIQNNDYAGIQDFLGTIPFYMISYNPTYYANPFAQQRCQTFRCMNCLSTDVLKVTFSTTSDGLTAITEYTTANVGSFAPRYSTFIIDIALSEVVESLQLQDSYGSYVIEESPSNVNLIKAKIQKWCKLPNVEVSYVGTILTITIPYFAGGTNLFFTVTTANGGSAYALVDNYGATSNFTFYQIISYSDINYFFISNGFTLSYSPGKGWVCFHDYIPKYLFNNSNGIYSVENTANGVVLTGQVFKHNTEGKYGIYYDDTVHKSYVDVIFNFEDTLEKIIDSIIFTTKVVDPITGGSNALSTATHIVVYNDHQCSEEIAIISNPSSWYKHNARLINGTWHFDEFIDKVIDNTLPFIDDDGELILTNIQTAKTWFKRNLFIGKFGIVRIIYDNSVQNQFTLLSANVITEEVTR